MEAILDQDCAAIVAEMAVYDVRTAVALWCANGKDHNVILESMEPIGESGVNRIIYKHPYISCVEARSRLIVSLMEQGHLSYGREDAEPEQGHIAYERRHFKAKHLKEYLEQHFPKEKPAFLFGQIERARSAGISPDEYTAVVSEKDELKARLEKARVVYQDQKARIAELELLLASKAPAGQRQLGNLNRIIAVLVEAALRQGVFESFDSKSERDLRTLISDKYDGFPGLSFSNLGNAFAEAKKHLEE